MIGPLGALGAISASLQQSWYQIILPDEERRLIAPRLGGITLGIGSVVLLPIAFAIDWLVDAVGLWAYAAPLAVAGIAGFVPLLVCGVCPPPAASASRARPYGPATSRRACGATAMS